MSACGATSAGPSSMAARATSSKRSRTLVAGDAVVGIEVVRSVLEELGEH